MSSDAIIVRPVAVTPAMITSSTVPETVAATYSGGTTYALGDLAGLAPVDGEAQIVYRSLQNSNTGHAQNDTAWWILVASVYPAYNAGVIYDTGDIVTDTTNHLLYISIANGHTGSALTDVTKWTNYGATNKYKMFDAIYNTQSTTGDDIVIVLTPGETITSIALLNLDAASVTVAQSVSGYSETVNLAAHNVLTWYDFFYEIPSRKTDVVLTDIPPYPASALTITIENGTSSASVGVIIIGRFRTLGETQWEGERSITDYSTVDQDLDTGDVTITRRSYAKRLSFEFRVPAGFETEVVKILEENRSVPVVVVASVDHDMTIIYGLLGDWSVPFTNSGKRARLGIKGLI